MTLTVTGSSDAQNVTAGSKVSWPFVLAADAPTITVEFNITTGPDGSDAPDWAVEITEKGEVVWSNLGSKPSYRFNAPKKVNASLVVTCPKGARYGDTVNITVTFTASATGEKQSVTYSARAIQSIMILKTQANQEKDVANSLRLKVQESSEKDIYAILSPVKLTGYVFVEGMNTNRMREKTRGIRKARQFLEGETSLQEIEMYFTPVPTVTGIMEGDIVELADGPFKGEKARVKFVDSEKESITVELIQGMIPIPVTVRGESVRRIDSDNKKE